MLLSSFCYCLHLRVISIAMQNFILICIQLLMSIHYIFHLLLLLRTIRDRLTNTLDWHLTVLVLKSRLVYFDCKFMSKEWLLRETATFLQLLCFWSLVFNWRALIIFWALFFKRLCLRQSITFWFFDYLCQSRLEQRRALKNRQLIFYNIFCFTIVCCIGHFHRSNSRRRYWVAIPSYIWILSKLLRFIFSLRDLVVIQLW
jgi:hypothetical protein